MWKICTFFMLTLALASCTLISNQIAVPVTITPMNSNTGYTKPSATPTIIGDGGLLTGEPCGPPCLWGIEPGKTSQVDASKILSKMGVLDRCKEIDEYAFAVADGLGGWTCLGILDVSFEKASGLVNFIRFELDDPLPMQRFVDIYGYPDFVVVTDIGLPEFPSSDVTLYYRTMGVVFPLQKDQSGKAYHIEPSTMLSVVTYLDEESMQEDLELFDDDALPWTGYGEYFTVGK